MACMSYGHTTLSKGNKSASAACSTCLTAANAMGKHSDHERLFSCKTYLAITFINVLLKRLQAPFF